MTLHEAITIRAASISDLPAIMDLERQSPASAHWSERQYQEIFSDPQKRLILVAECSAPNLAGFLVSRHLPPEWELENIVVAASVRRKRVGTRLMDTFLAKARETKGESVFLEVRESNAAARGLYEKAGFTQMARRKSYYSKPAEDAIVYRLALI